MKAQRRNRGITLGGGWLMPCAGCFATVNDLVPIV